MQRVAVAPSEKRVRPVQPGTSVGATDGTTGTICCLVVDDSGKRYLLSADHVFESRMGLKPGTSVLQPGALDGGQMSDRVATLTRFVTPRAGLTTHAAGAPVMDSGTCSSPFLAEARPNFRS